MSTELILLLSAVYLFTFVRDCWVQYRAHEPKNLFDKAEVPDR